MKPVPKREQLPSGKVIISYFDDEAGLVADQHTYGAIDVGINREFKLGLIVDETYFVNSRRVTRRSYEKARLAYPDMPAADSSSEDLGRSVMQLVRAQQKQKKADAERRLAESAESRFPRPASTNWLRVISQDKSHW